MKTTYRSILAVFALAIFTVSTATMQAQDYLFETNNGTITITKYTGPGGNVTLPETINGLPVTTIGNRAFENCTSLTSITIPNGVTNIGFCAFWSCTSLTNAKIGAGLTAIGSSPFLGCSSLLSITVDVSNSAYSSLDGALFDKGQRVLIQFPAGKAGSYAIPNGVVSFGVYAFEGCSLTSITIPNSVTSIGEMAFRSCKSLASVTIGNRVTTIGDRAFEGCVMLANIVIPDSVIDMGGGAFVGCAGLTNATIGNRVTRIRTWTNLRWWAGAFSDCTALARVTIGNSVKNIDTEAFRNCTSLTSITIPSSVTNIGGWAFFGCSSLTNVVISSSATTFSGDPFEGCYRLPYVRLGNGIIFFWRGPPPVGPVTIPETIQGLPVTCVGGGSFSSFSGLTSVTIPNSVTTIGASAFSSCTGLTGVYFKGNAPLIPPLGSTYPPFSGATNATIYYLPGTIGWSDTYAERPTASWILPCPIILTTTPNFGIQNNAFGFRISWATNVSVVVEASASLANPDWFAVSTNTLVDGWTYFSDSAWTSYPARFYRVRQW